MPAAKAAANRSSHDGAAEESGPGAARPLLAALGGQDIEQVTPTQLTGRGCQLSLRFRGGRERARAVLARLEQDAFLLDFREPDILRIAPVPLYNGFEDVWCFVDGLRTALEATA